LHRTEADIDAVVADDEPLARELLLRLLADQPGIRVTGVAADGASTRRLITDAEPDLVFLDVEMPGMSGVDMMAAWPPQAVRPYVVFVTAYDEYATMAFDLDAVDYLVKPVVKDRLSRALDRARRTIAASRIAAAAQTPAGNPAANVGAVVIRQRDEIIRLDESEILWLEAASQYVYVHAESGRYIVAETLSRFHRRLSPDRFLRVHRSAVVNVAKVARVLRRSNGLFRLQLANDTSVPLSRSRRRMLDTLLAACAGNRLRGEAAR